MTKYRFQNQAVRDLAWACFSPSLLETANLPDVAPDIDNCGIVLTASRLNWLRALDEDPKALLDHISASRNPRLGIYFERLWQFFLGKDPQITLTAHNLPVRQDGLTVGEFDCIYYCHLRQAHYHLELAVKYFLSHRTVTASVDCSQAREWWGPECRDRLDLKVDHLLKRQICLSDHPAAQAVLSELGVSHLSREVEVKGYLFQGVNDELSPPAGFNSANALQHWVYLNDLENPEYASQNQRYKVLEKPGWLSPVWQASRSNQLDISALRDKLQLHFEHSQRPQLVAGLDEHGNELKRFFVVGNVWPEQDAGAL